jgi:NADPH-dependent curcumin reductase CurA
VGGYAVQLGKAAGLRVIAYASAAGEDLVRGLGADAVVRRGEDFGGQVRAVSPGGAAVYPAGRAAEAHRRLEAGGVRGRLVLEF